MTRPYFFVAKGLRSRKSHAPTYENFYKVESHTLLDALRAVREKEPHANIYALEFDAEKRYKNREFILLLILLQASPTA